MICTFLKHKETVKAADVAKNVFGKSSKRLQILEKVEHTTFSLDKLEHINCFYFNFNGKNCFQL